MRTGNRYEDCQNFFALVLLYITGLRVQNLVYLRIRHIHELLEKGETILPLIKKGHQHFRFQLSEGDLQILRSSIEKVRIVCEDRKAVEFLFRARHNLKRCIHHDCNSTLMKY